MMLPTLIYLHGFLSSPQSEKAVQTVAYFRAHHPQVSIEVPLLSGQPDQAFALLDALIQQHPGARLIGSSLGGLFASYMAEKLDGRAVLINPAIHPAFSAQQFLGWQENPYTGEKVHVTQEGITQLQNLEPEQITPERYWVCLQTADEVLDYRLARDRYAQSHMTIIPGGNHAFIDYDQYLPAIADFLYGSFLRRTT
jgi:predicted esterase YcpF (UPF0227 family)